MAIGIDEPLEVLVELVPGRRAGHLLGRALGAVAARCELPLDRIDEALLSIDVLCEAAGDDPLRVLVTGMAGEVWLRVGPLGPGAAEALLDRPAILGGPPLLPTLADRTAILEDGTGAVLSFTARR